MSGRMARNKGQRGEREVIAMLQPVVDKVVGWTGEECGVERIVLKRNLLQTREGGCDLEGLEWLSLEVKRVERQGGLEGWWKQCLRQAQRGGGEPVLMYRPNNSPWRVRMKVWVRGGGRGARMVRCTVNVDIQTFLVYFEERLRWELNQ